MARFAAVEEHGSAKRGRSDQLYEPLGWMLLRAPLLSVAELGRLVGRPAAAFDPRVDAALAVGSPDLREALRRDVSRRDAARAQAKLRRYLIRMSTRPTPYGLFAGVGLVEPGLLTDVAIEHESPRTRTRPDMAWLLELVDEAESRPEVRRRLRWFANPAAFVHAGRLYLDRPPASAGAPNLMAVSIRAGDAVRRVFSVAREPVPYQVLAAELGEAPGADPAKIERLLTGLCEQTVLLSELRPPLTVESPARHVAARLAGLGEAADLHEQLAELLAAAEEWDRLTLENKASGYGKLVSAASRRGRKQLRNPVVQVDMAMPLRGGLLNEAVAREAARLAEMLLRMSPPPDSGVLAGMRQAFVARYGHDREVPLLELLDPTFGIGFSAGHGWRHEAIEPQRSRRRQQLLLDLALTALRDGTRIVELDEQTVAGLQTWTPVPESAPSSLDIAVFVVATSPAAIDAGEFQIILGPNLGAQTAGRNLGRFADLLGSKAVAALREAAGVEAQPQPGRIVAEIVYLPAQPRSANVAIRPLVRDYEIALGTMPSAPADRVVPLDELIVGLSGERFTVRWPAADVEVEVSAAHMLNNVQAPPVCQFLEAVSRERTAQLAGFDWGPANSFPFVPRVQHGRAVLALARWRLDAAGSGPARLNQDPEIFARHLAKWRARWSAPRYVYLSVGDNRLLLDLDDSADVEQIRDEAKRLPEGAHLHLEEALPGLAEAWLPGLSGGHITELVVPVKLRRAVAERSATRPTAPNAKLPVRERAQLVDKADRLRPPGSDWLFFKLYCPHSLQDDLITREIRSFCEFAVAAGLADEWFFLRYSDPDPHVRLRFHGDPGELTRRLFPEACAWAGRLIEAHRCLRFCIDTYEREVERYGGIEGTAVTERIFAADSRFVADALHHTGRSSTPVDRTELAVLGVDHLLASLGLSDHDRLAFLRARADVDQESGREYRQRKQRLRDLLGQTERFLLSAAGGGELFEALAARATALATTGPELQGLAEHGALATDLRQLHHNYVHLHLNRLLERRSPEETRVLSLLRRTREGLDRAPVSQRAGSAPEGAAG
jgi:lantibiotic biosynthesis protein